MLFIIVLIFICSSSHTGADIEPYLPTLMETMLSALNNAANLKIKELAVSAIGAIGTKLSKNCLKTCTKILSRRFSGLLCKLKVKRNTSFHLPLGVFGFVIGNTLLKLKYRFAGEQLYILVTGSYQPRNTCRSLWHKTCKRNVTAQIRMKWSNPLWTTVLSANAAKELLVPYFPPVIESLKGFLTTTTEEMRSLQTQSLGR